MIDSNTVYSYLNRFNCFKHDDLEINFMSHCSYVEIAQRHDLDDSSYAFIYFNKGFTRIYIDNEIPADELIVTLYHELTHYVYKKTKASMKHKWRRKTNSPYKSAVLVGIDLVDEFCAEFCALKFSECRISAETRIHKIEDMLYLSDSYEIDAGDIAYTSDVLMLLLASIIYYGRSSISFIRNKKIKTAMEELFTEMAPVAENIINEKTWPRENNVFLSLTSFMGSIFCLNKVEKPTC